MQVVDSGSARCVEDLMPRQSRVFRLRFLLLCGVCCLLVVADTVCAQSTDPTFPTPVGSKEIDGAIAARDLGDSRVTHQYYGFIGAPGDLVVTVQAKNFNGDFDIFTAGDLRPLLKITVYAELGSQITKNIYLRRRENLILRVEGRTPNDDDATYEIRFSGSFEVIPGGVLLAKVDRATSESGKESSQTSNRRGSRVSSVGARIEEPPAAVAAAPTTKPTPEVTSAPEAAKSEAAAPVKRPPVRNSSARRGTARQPAKLPSERRPAQPAKPQAKTTADAEKQTSKAEEPAPTITSKAAVDKKTVDEKKPETSESERKAPAARRTSKRRSSTVPRTSKAPPEESGGRLDIERKDGSHLKMEMRLVTRVTVENGQILIVTKDGSLISVPMSNVARMSIGP